MRGFESWFVPITLFLSGVLCVALAVPLIRRRVRPNLWYGVRLTSTLANPTVWYAVNARSGWDLVWFGLVVAVAGPVVLAPSRWPMPGTEVQRIVSVVALLLGGMLIVSIRAWRHAARLTRVGAAAPAPSAAAPPAVPLAPGQ